MLTAGSPLGQRLVYSHGNINEDKGCQLQDREGIYDYNFTWPMRNCFVVWTICIHDILKFFFFILYAIFSFCSQDGDCSDPSSQDVCSACIYSFVLHIMQVIYTYTY